MRLILSATFLLMLAACSSMDKAECRTADWHAIGYEDGAQGRTIATFARRRSDCAEHGVTPDFAAYSAGRAEGLARYCRPQNGYRLGRRGQRYSGVCPKPLEHAFLAAQADGLGLHKRSRRVTQLRYRLDKSTKRMADIDRIIAHKTASLLVPTMTVQQRASIAIDIKELAEEKGSLRLAIPGLEQELAEAQQDRDAFYRYVASRYGN